MRKESYDFQPGKVLRGIIFPEPSSKVAYSFQRVTLVLAVVVLSGCNTFFSVTDENETQAAADESLAESMTPKERRSALVTVYNEWKGTGYLLGGESKKGIDCSAFVQHAMQDALGTTLGRTTVQQRQEGIRIAARNLEPADLVFFKTGPTTNHVGIYLGSGEFMHASSSNGVAISSLSSLYWEEVFEQARRVVVAPSSRSLAEERNPTVAPKKTRKKARRPASGTWTTHNKKPEKGSGRIGW